MEGRLHEHLGVAEHVGGQVGRHVKVLHMVLVCALLEPRAVGKLVPALDVLDLHAAERLPIRAKAHNVVGAPGDERLRTVELHVVAPQQPIEEELCDGTLVRRLDGLIAVSLRPFYFWLALEHLEDLIRTILLLHKVGHVLAVDLPRLLGVLTLEEADLDAVVVRHAHVRHRVVLSALHDGRKGLK